jgi:hypothetical protein
MYGHASTSTSACHTPFTLTDYYCELPIQHQYQYCEPIIPRSSSMFHLPMLDALHIPHEHMRYKHRTTLYLYLYLYTWHGIWKCCYYLRQYNSQSQEAIGHRKFVFKGTPGQREAKNLKIKIMIGSYWLAKGWCVLWSLSWVWWVWQHVKASKTIFNWSRKITMQNLGGLNAQQQPGRFWLPSPPSLGQ